MTNGVLLAVREVPANQLWVDTSVQVEAGETLKFSASGKWVDAFIPCSADGYAAPLFYALGVLPRIPDDGRYFRLMGRISPTGIEPTDDHAATTFVIGNRCQREIAQSGRLFVFANDRKGF
jgi:hypothetical protein